MIFWMFRYSSLIIQKSWQEIVESNKLNVNTLKIKEVENNSELKNLPIG